MQNKAVKKQNKKTQRDRVWTMMMMGHTLTKRTNSALCTHSFKLVVGFPSQGREDCHPEWRMWPGKSLGRLRTYSDYKEVSSFLIFFTRN